MFPFGMITGVNLNLTPNSLNEMLTAVKPCPGWTMGKGNSPPARKLASLPFTAIKFGSARICKRFFCCNAWTTTPKLMSLRNKKRFKGFVRLMVGGVGAVVVVLTPLGAVCVLLDFDEPVLPPYCPVVKVPVV